MKKTTRNIIIALAVLLVLGIAAAALMLTEPETVEEETSSSSAVEETAKIVDKAITDVESVVLENNESGETLTMIPTKSEEDKEENNTFTLEGWEKEPVINANVLNVASKFYSITPSKELGEVEDLAEYGLKGDGEFKATVNYTDGTSDVIIVGTQAGETYGRYALYNDLVYIIPVSSYLANDKLDFISTEVYTIPDIVTTDDEGNETTETAEMQKARLSGTNYPDAIQLSLSNDAILTYEISEPIFAGASTTHWELMVEQLQTITASSAIAVQATEAEIAEYGLDDPTNVIEYTLNDESHTIRLGTLDGGFYSMMVDDNTTIYLIEESSVDSWAGCGLFDFRDAYIYLAYIKYVETLTITTEDTTDVYNITRIENEEKSTETTPYYDLEVAKDGQAIDYDNYQPFYQMLLSVSVLNEEIREPEGEPILTIHYDFFDGGEEHEVCFYEDTSVERRCIVTLDGAASGVVRSSDVEKILEAVPVIAANESIE